MIKIFGRNVVKEAVRANRKITEIDILETVKTTDSSFLKLCADKKIKVNVLSRNEMDKRYLGLHQGYGALAEDYKYYELEEVIDQSKAQVFIILDGLEDPVNLGAIIRTAEAAGIAGIIIPKNRSVSLNATVAKVAAGALEYVKIISVNNLNRTIEILKKHGFWIVGTDMSGEKTIYDLDLTGSLGIVIGSEGSGIRRLVQQNCDFVVKIPMYGKINSLNASVSCGILMYEIVRRNRG
ncbi:MAG: 23S rRNA (guanosine(2251)-2'-O)-methyltransferase RlmB [Erysipelotrichales bacterium]|nr:23S rRNA (guanosine(2251)-2'-O)-methyltransferase RlmB [Erysipelotrichales bacterium]